MIMGYFVLKYKAGGKSTAILSGGRKKVHTTWDFGYEQVSLEIVAYFFWAAEGHYCKTKIRRSKSTMPQQTSCSCARCGKRHLQDGLLRGKLKSVKRTLKREAML